MNNNYGTDYAVGWFTLALLNAGLAQSKKRSGLAWFFAYVDLRIRRDCWDLELALAEEAQRWRPRES